MRATGVQLVNLHGVQARGGLDRDLSCAPLQDLDAAAVVEVTPMPRRGAATG